MTSLIYYKDKLLLYQQWRHRNRRRRKQCSPTKFLLWHQRTQARSRHALS